MWEEAEAAKEEEQKQEQEEQEQEDQGDDEVQLSLEEARQTAIDQLATVFKEQHGREPTAEEVNRWTASFEAALSHAQKPAAAEGPKEDAGDGLALPSFGAGQR